jgi:nucleoid-associated protein YgaU
MSPVADAGSSALSGSPELSQASLSNVSGADFAKANQFFQPADGGVASQALTGLDIQGIAAPPAPMAGTEALAMVPPTGGLEATALTAAPGAEPISPLIQMILKMPGAMGFVSSIFDFFAAFFNPTTWFDLLSPAMWAQHAAAAFSSTAAQLPTISMMSMLPANAPILSSLTNFGQPMFSSDLLSAKLNLSLGNQYSTLAKSGVDAMQTNSLNVGAELTPQSAVYETGMGATAVPGQVPTGHLSGPSLTDVGSANHVATNTRLFSDRLAGGGSFNSMNLATKSPLGTNGVNTVANNSMSHGMNSMSHGGAYSPPGSFLNNARFEGAPQLANNLKTSFAPNAGHEVGYSGMGHDVGYSGMNSAPNTDASGVSYGPSGYVGNDLAGNKNLIAMDQPTQSFKPTLSGADANQFRSASMGGGDVTGLKAKQLSLDSLDAPQSAATNTANGAGSKLAGASSQKVSSLASNKPVGDAASKVSHQTAKHAVPKHGAEAPKHAAPKHVEAPKQIARAETGEPIAQQTQQVDANAIGQDGTIADGTQIAATDSTAATQYVVQKGDSLWNIAKDQLGGGAKWQEIYQLNQNLIGQNPDLIYPGTTLQLPGGGSEIANAGTTSLTNYTVKPGDNLWDISHDMLGEGKNWGEIYNLNKDVIGANPSLIHPGQQLQIPTGGSAAGSVASSAVPPATPAVDPSSMAAPSTQAPQPVSADMSGAMRNADPVKSMQGTEYSAAGAEHFAPQRIAPESISSYPDSQPLGQLNPNSQLGFEQPVAQSKGLPVIPANSTPIEAGPGAAYAATPQTAVDAGSITHNVVTANDAAATAHSMAGKSPVVAGGVFSNLKAVFGKPSK